MADKKHNFTKAEIKAGILVLASGVVFVIFVAAILSLRPPKPMKTFYADFVNTKGLQVGAEVMFGGLKVGKVTERGLLDEHQSLIRIAFQVNENVPVNKESKASIAQVTLTSDNHLEISTGNDRAELLPPGEVIPSQEGGIFDVAGLVANDVRDLLGDIRILLGVKDQTDQSLVTIEDLFEGVQTAVDEGTGAVKDVRDMLNDNRDEIDSIVKRVEDIEDSAHTLVKDINSIVTDNRPLIDKSMQSVQKTTERIEASSRKLEAMANSLQGTLDNAGKLTTDASAVLQKARPVIEDIILDLRETVWHLKSFARTIEEQPESVLRGATPQGRKR